MSCLAYLLEMPGVIPNMLSFIREEKIMPSSLQFGLSVFIAQMKKYLVVFCCIFKKSKMPLVRKKNRFTFVLKFYYFYLVPCFSEAPAGFP